MGKSLRSKSKLRAKSVKRVGEFSDFVDARNARLAEKLKKKTDAQAKDDEKMDTDKPKSDKVSTSVSTSGWRDLRKQQYKKRNLKKKKSVTKF